MADANNYLELVLHKVCVCIILDLLVIILGQRYNITMIFESGDKIYQ